MCHGRRFFSALFAIALSIAFLSGLIPSLIWRAKFWVGLLVFWLPIAVTFSTIIWGSLGSVPAGDDMALGIGIVLLVVTLVAVAFGLPVAIMGGLVGSALANKIASGIGRVLLGLALVALLGGLPIGIFVLRY